MWIVYKKKYLQQNKWLNISTGLIYDIILIIFVITDIDFAIWYYSKISNANPNGKQIQTMSGKVEIYQDSLILCGDK